MFQLCKPRNGQYAPLLSEVHKVMDNVDFLDSHIIYNRDFNYDYFGFTLKMYLLKINGKIVGASKHMLMRVSW
jgi:ribonucleoside-diphosphate reductase alpha chain